MKLPYLFLISVMGLLFTGCASDETVVSRELPMDTSTWTNRVRVLGVNDARFEPTRLMTQTVFTGPFADYDRRLDENIRQRWQALRRSQPALAKKGSAEFRFRLYPNGTVGDIEVEYSSLDRPTLRNCYKAIIDGAPYEKFIFPAETPVPVPDFREMRFSFHVG